MRWWQRQINEGGDKVRVKVLGCQGGTAPVTSPEYRGGGRLAPPQPRVASRRWVGAAPEGATGGGNRRRRPEPRKTTGGRADR
jgi:hypothetical protein